MTTCKYCRSFDCFFEDYSTGDTICTNCGTCESTVFETLGQSFSKDVYYTHHLEKNHKTLVQQSHFVTLKKRVEYFLEVFNVEESLHEYAFGLVNHLQNKQSELRGNSRDAVCFTILLKMYETFEIFFDMKTFCNVYQMSSKKILALKQTLFPFDNNSLDTNAIKFQKNVIKSATDLTIEKPRNFFSLLQTANKLSKSIKMKTAVVLFSIDPSKIKDIIKYTDVQRTQLLHAYAEFQMKI